MISILESGASRNHNTLISQGHVPIVLRLFTEPITDMLFQPSEKNPPLREQLYLFMKRFKTQPSEFYALGREERLDLFNREVELMKRENEKAEAVNSQTPSVP